MLSSLMNYNRPLLRHVAAPLFHLADQKLLRRQQKPLSQVTGVVNNPVCDPGGFLWGCCLQLIRCEASCSGAVRAAGRAMSALIRRRGGEMDFKSVVSQSGLRLWYECQRFKDAYCDRRDDGEAAGLMSNLLQEASGGGQWLMCAHKRK